MSKWHTLQNSFLEGEVSPRFVAAVDSGLADNGALEILNGIVLLQGNATTRMGSQFLLDTVASDKFVRIWPFFDVDNRNGLTIWKEFTVDIVRLPDLGVGVPNALQALNHQQLVTNSSFVLGLTAWTNTGIYTVDNISYTTRATPVDTIDMGVQFVDSRSAVINDVFIRQSLTVFDTAHAFTVVVRAIKLLPDDTPVNVQLRVKIGQTLGSGNLVDELLDLTGVLSTQTVNVAVPGGIAGSLFFEVLLVLDGLSDVGISRAEEYRAILTQILVYSDVGVPLETDTVVTPYVGVQVEQLHFIQSPFDNQELIVLHPDFTPHMLYLDPNDSMYKFEPYDFSTPPAGIETGNFPSIATAFQGRLILTGAGTETEKIWASKNNDWKDFGAEVSPVPDDGLEFTPTDRGINTWLTGFKTLLFGNTRREYSVSSQTGLLQPTDIGVGQQSSYGALRLPQKMTLGHSVVLPTGGNTSLRMMRFNRDDNGFIAPDIMLKAEHLGRKIIRQYFHTKDPHEMLWCIMADGSMSVLSFEQDMKIYAWSHFITDGRFIDGCVLVDAFGRDTVMLVIERIINGTTVKYIETISDLRNIQNWQYIDSHIRLFNPTSETTIGGLEHLEAKTVAVFMDEAFFNFQVVKDGLIEVDEGSVIIDVGLAYNFRVTTLPQDSLAPEIGLTSKKRYSKVGIRGVFSRPPMVNGQRAPDRGPQSIMNLPEPAQLLLDSDVVDLNWNQLGTVTISEDLPIRLTIAGIYGKLSSTSI